MHVISRKARCLFREKHPGSKGLLSRWFGVVDRSTFDHFDVLHATFPSADQMKGLVVFNIRRNKERLMASIHFNRGKVYIRHVLTHEEYDRGAWKS